MAASDDRRHEGQQDGPQEAARRIEDSAVVMARVMEPPDANSAGNVHGGVIMRFLDEAGGAAAIRHARRRCVTVAMDAMTFSQPVYIGDLLTIHAHLTYVGRTSVEVEGRAEAENLLTGEIRQVGRCYLVYVALGEDGRPTPVPSLTLETDEQRTAWRAAEERQARRIARGAS